MSAIPLRQEAPKTCILKLYNADYALDPYADRLMSQGYEVVNVHNYEDALEEVQRYHPALIVVYDDPDTDIDAVHWLEMQHSHRAAWMAMTPLLILADASRVPELSIHALPDRVVILRRHADTLNQLTRAVKRLLRVWQLE